MDKELKFLLYSTPNEDVNVNVVVKDENLWLTQKAMAELFDVNVPAISKHLKNIFESGELLEDSVLYVLERKKLKALFSEDLHIANWGRRYAEMELLAAEERLISMLSAVASERYHELLEKEPDLLQRLPLGSIATYLGITQASLSRIRAQIK